jgi:hypothetical protein
MTNQLTVKINIQDWLEECQRDELEVKEKADIIKAIEEGKSTSKVACAALVCRELSVAQEDIIRPNKSLLLDGASGNIISIVRNQTHEVTLFSGAVEEVHDFNGRITNVNGTEPEAEDDTGPSFVGKNDPLYIKRAQRYLEERVPGHIEPRLIQIYESGGDVHEAIKMLHTILDEMETRILG